MLNLDHINVEFRSDGSIVVRRFDIEASIIEVYVARRNAALDWDMTAGAVAANEHDNVSIN